MEKAEAIIRKVGNQYCVFSHDGKNLGCSTSHDGAVKRLQQVEYFKHSKGSSMDYNKAFDNFTKAFSVGDVDPKSVGQAPAPEPNKIETPLSEKLRHGTIANRASSRLLDSKDHFPVITETQAQSSMARVLQLIEAPDWYNGTIAQLRKDVYDGILALHPNIQLNVRVPVEQAVALSDGQTPAETSKTSVKDPADVAKDLVPQIKRPTLTSAEMHVALANEDTRKAFAGRLMQMIDSQLEQMQSAKQLATRLLSGGVTSAEFDKLSTYIQQDILGELLSSGITASTQATEDRRRQLLDKMSNKNG